MATKMIPYGKTDFVDIISRNFYYVDKTNFIEDIEQSPDYLFLIRPRRFGKSLTLNMLSAYYDVNYKDRFDELFGNLYIGKHPTGNQNKYLILYFNFSQVRGDSDTLESSFENHCRNQFILFLDKYEHFFDKNFRTELLEQPNATSKLEYLSNKASQRKLSIYLLIDEYDNFANTILSTPMSGEARYKALTHGEGFFRYFFNVVKGATTANDAGIKKIFITGVSPLTMDDVTSGFNIGTNITTAPKFNSLVGFTLDDVTVMLNYYKSEGLINQDINILLDIMKEWYDNYCFSEDCIGENVFNTDMALYFIYNLVELKKIPPILVDKNVKVDYGKLRHLIVLDKKLNGNFSKIKEIAENGELISSIQSSFSIEEMRDSKNFVSLLFYFGILTIDRIEYGKTVLKVPNLAIQNMLFSYIIDSYKDTNVFKINIDRLEELMFGMAYKGEWRGVFDFMAEQVKAQTTVRDYINSEKAVQTLHVAYMNMFNYFILYPEYEANFGFTDLWMQPNFLNYVDMKYSYVVEFKYVPRAEKYDLEAIEARAAEQLNQYVQDDKVKSTKGGTELRKIIVVYYGWEMVGLKLM